MAKVTALYKSVEVKLLLHPSSSGMSDVESNEKHDEISLGSKVIPEDDNSIPNGGLVAWLQVLGGFFLLFNTSGMVNSFGVFQTYYESHILLNENASRISWIGSLQGCLSLLVGALTGPLFDLGYFRHMILFGTLLLSFALMMTSLCDEYWQFMLAQSLCFGLAAACLCIPGMAITSTYFSTRRAFALGVVASGSSIGAVVYTVVFRNLEDKVGFPWTVRVFGFIAFGTLAVSNVVMRPRIAPAHRRSLFAWHAFKEPAFVTFVFGICIGFMGAYIPFYHVSAYAMKRTGSSETLAFYLIAIMNGASAVGRILPNFLADKIGPFNTMIPLAACSAILAFGWMGIESVPSICVFAVLYGFMTGAYVSLPTACVASITKDLHEVGARVGMCFMFAGIGMLIGNPIAGALVDLETGTFWKAQLCCAMLVLGSMVCLLLSRFFLSRKIMVKY